MQTPTDITTLHTSREVIEAKLAIEAVKIQLSDAPLVLAQAQQGVVRAQGMDSACAVTFFRRFVAHLRILRRGRQEDPSPDLCIRSSIGDVSFSINPS